MNINKKVENNIGFIGLNRPDKRNSLSTDLVVELLTALDEYEKSSDVRVILLYGEGKAFSAGGDIETMNSLVGVQANLEYMKGASKVAQRIKELDKLVVSAVHGFAAGAGFSMALASDFIVATEDAKFISSFTNVGLIPDLGLIKNLAEKIPSNVAKQWIVAGTPISVKEADEYGLINQIATSDLLEEAMAFCSFIVASPPLASTFSKYLVNNINEFSEKSSFMMENLVQTLLLQTKDNEEGLNAFLEKRNPVFQGD